MSETTTKKRRRSRKSKKEQETINEEETVQEQQQQQPRPGDPIELYNNMSVEQSKKLMERPDIQEKMLDMDIRIKYGFMRTIHNNYNSINDRINWKPEELMGIGMLFGDLNGIERTVFNQVMSDMDNEDEEEVVEEEEEEEASTDVN